jgi:hypothetical protein
VTRNAWKNSPRKSPSQLSAVSEGPPLRLALPAEIIDLTGDDQSDDDWIDSDEAMGQVTHITLPTSKPQSLRPSSLSHTKPHVPPPSPPLSPIVTQLIHGDSQVVTTSAADGIAPALHDVSSIPINSVRCDRETAIVASVAGTSQVILSFHLAFILKPGCIG